MTRDRQSDWLTIDEAVALIIEKNPKIQLPFHYEIHLGGTTVNALERCAESATNLFNSAIGASEEERRRFQRKLDHAKFVLELGTRIESNLRQESYMASRSSTSILEWDDSTPPRVCKPSLIEWAWITEKTDVDGFRARREGNTPPLTPRYTDEIPTSEIRKRVDSVVADHAHAWRDYLEAEHRQKLFLANVCVLELYLDRAESNWRKEITRQGINDVMQLYEKGVVQLPPLKKTIEHETGLSEPTSRKLLTRLLERSLGLIDLTKAVFTEREENSGSKLLIGLALAFGKEAGAIVPSTDRAPFLKDPRLLLDHLSNAATDDENATLRSLEKTFAIAWRRYAQHFLTS
ncbi:MAG: hypothetical protein AAF662_03140 [Pseudomonadota bacterium]